MAGESSDSPIWGLAPGAVVAGYQVEERIGAGGMATVFRARDVGLGRTVALKILAPALAGDQEFRERFIRESRAAAAVDHAHIIPVYAAGETDGVLYIAMRYVPSGDLRALLSLGPEDRAALQIAAADNVKRVYVPRSSDWSRCPSIVTSPRTIGRRFTCS